MVSIWAPIGYLLFLVGSLTLFSRIYRRKSTRKPEPWFPPHPPRDIYISLLSLEPPPPQPILVAALLRRAIHDVRLIWQVRDQKAALTVLLQKGQIGDETWERFLLAEKELEAEIVEVVGEANTFQPGYGNQIFAVASDMVQHEKWKEVYQNIPKARETEKARQSSHPTSRVLAPTSYLTPSSLTLYPSNPLPAQPSATTDTPEPASAAGASAPTTSPAAQLTPLAATDLTSAPPSREPTPQPPAAASTAAAEAPQPTPPASTPMKKTDSASSATGTPSAAGSTPATPSSAKKAKGKKKKPVKGGK